MDSDFASGPRRQNTRSSVGPIVLLLPLAFLILGLSFLKDAGRSVIGPRANPPEPPAEETIAGWEGELELDGGGRLRATLGPLHADAERQEFERRALEAKLELREGEPFRLELEVTAGALPTLATTLRVVDSSGLAQVPIVPEATGEPSGLADPLLVLLGPPSVDGASRASWFLWGRPPGETVQLEGLSVGALSLNPKSIPRSRVDVALLRRDLKDNR